MAPYPIENPLRARRTLALYLVQHLATGFIMPAGARRNFIHEWYLCSRSRAHAPRCFISQYYALMSLKRFIDDSPDKHVISDFRLLLTRPSAAMWYANTTQLTSQPERTATHAP